MTKITTQAERVKQFFVGALDTDKKGRVGLRALMKVMKKIGVVMDEPRWRELIRKFGEPGQQGEPSVSVEGFKRMASGSNYISVSLEGFFEGVRQKLGPEVHLLPLPFLVDVYNRELYLRSIMGPK